MATVQKRPARTRPPVGYVPPGWPLQVRPPGVEDWERTASAFLLDCCPADYRAYPVLRRHPAVLAWFAAAHVEAQVSAAADGLGGLRRSLEDHVPPEVVQAAVEAWEEQSARLQRIRREVALVEEALRGRVFVQRLT